MADLCGDMVRWTIILACGMYFAVCRLTEAIEFLVPLTQSKQLEVLDTLTEAAEQGLHKIQRFKFLFQLYLIRHALRQTPTRVCNLCIKSIDGKQFKKQIQIYKHNIVFQSKVNR